MKPHTKTTNVDQDATVKPLGGKPKANSASTAATDQHDQALAEIEAREAELISQNAAAAAQMDELTRQKQETLEARQQAKRQERDELRAQATYYRELAKECDDKTRTDELLKWAVDAEGQARRIVIEGEPDVDAAKSTTQERNWPWYLSGGFWAGVFSTVALSGVLFVTQEYFEMIGEMILKANTTLPPEQQMQPYDITSFQKLAFEKMVQFSDLPVALIMLLLVMPRVAIYVLPFTRTKPDFWYEFKHELTPWQRCALATSFVLGFLFLAVLVHLVKL